MAFRVVRQTAAVSLAARDLRWRLQANRLFSGTAGSDCAGSASRRSARRLRKGSEPGGVLACEALAEAAGHHEAEGVGRPRPGKQDAVR